jgi:hypothetical protein
MKICVYGAGAIGEPIEAQLARIGEDAALAARPPSRGFGDCSQARSRICPLADKSDILRTFITSAALRHFKVFSRHALR